MEFLTHEQIGARIKAARLEKGLTQSELAAKLNIGRTAITKWEKGVIKNLKRDTIQQIADILEMSPLTMIGVEETPKPKTITISADEFTEEQFAQIEQFIEFIRLQNNNKK